MVKESRKFKKGGSTDPKPTKSARLITDATFELIQNYYQTDEGSRTLPGKKDYVSVKVP